MASITKKNKLYFRDKNEVIRRLDKVAPQIYIYIITQFLKGEAEKEYQELNKGVTSWKGFKPIEMTLPEDHKMSFNILANVVNTFKKPKSIVISHNGSWRPLVNLRMPNIIESIKKEKEKEKKNNGN